ncbi:MAG TPA: glycosyltransferase, partial [Flavisolibacter sp.]
PIAFIIITYNRPADTLALLQNIAGMEKANELLEEIVLINNASNSDYAKVEAYIAANKQLPVYYYFSDENLGVARGRNLAIQKSKAPILIMLDDDAVLQNSDAFVRLIAEYEKVNTAKPKAIVSFKVLYYDTLEIQENAFPHKKFSKYKDKKFFETYYYAGGAHAIKRDALNRVGSYPVDFFYGMEEYDLSYRILDAGYSIVYSDAIVMLHKESPLGRKPKNEKLRMMWLNKAKVAWRYLPRKYYFSTAIMWSVQYLKTTSFDLAGFFKGWNEVLSIIKKEKRSPIKKETVQYLKKVEARLWY